MMMLKKLFAYTAAAVVPMGASAADPQVDVKTSLGSFRVEIRTTAIFADLCVESVASAVAATTSAAAAAVPTPRKRTFRIWGDLLACLSGLRPGRHSAARPSPEYPATLPG